MSSFGFFLQILVRIPSGSLILSGSIPHATTLSCGHLLLRKCSPDKKTNETKWCSPQRLRTAACSQHFQLGRALPAGIDTPAISISNLAACSTDFGFYRAWPISTAGSLSCPPVSRGMEITMFSMATCSLTHPDTSQPDHRLFGLLPGEGWKLRGLSISQSLQAQALLCFAC